MNKKTPLEKMEKELEEIKKRVKKIEKILEGHEKEYDFDKWEGTD